MAAKEKCRFDWEGCRLSVFPDLTQELAEKRMAFTVMKLKLQERNVKYKLAFPATLHVKWKGKNLSFNSAKAAEISSATMKSRRRVCRKGRLQIRLTDDITLRSLRHPVFDCWRGGRSHHLSS